MEVNVDDLDRWISKYIKRMEELHSKQELSVLEADEYKLCVTLATLLSDVGDDLRNVNVSEIREHDRLN